MGRRAVGNVRRGRSLVSARVWVGRSGLGLWPGPASRGGRFWVLVPYLGVVGLRKTGAISSVIPVNCLSRSDLAGRDMPRHLCP